MDVKRGDMTTIGSILYCMEKGNSQSLEEKTFKTHNNLVPLINKSYLINSASEKKEYKIYMDLNLINSQNRLYK